LRKFIESTAIIFERSLLARELLPASDDDVHFTPAKDLERSGLPREIQLAIVGAAVNTWFDQARGHGILTMQNNELQVQPYASTLFGVLVTQIAHVIARSDQKTVCAGCRNPFAPARPIVRGSRQYCTICRKRGVPQRDASRDWRRRAREKQVGADRRPAP